MFKKLLALSIIFLFLICPIASYTEEAKEATKCTDLDVQIKEKSLEKMLIEIAKAKQEVILKEQELKINALNIDATIKEAIKQGIRTEGDVVHLYLEYIDYSNLWKNLQYIKTISPKKLVIHLFSFGGSVFDALAMIGLIENIETSGTIVEIRAKGLAASAGLIILVSGTKGYRYLDKNSMAMFHELQSISFFKIDTPTSKEDEARVLRKIQDKINNYIASRSKLTFEEICGRIKSKELWLDAQEAVELGLADKIE